MDFPVGGRSSQRSGNYRLTLRGASDMADNCKESSRLNLTRRSVVQGAGALLALSATAFPMARAFAQEPQRGGHLKLGLSGGASADTLDPALASATVAFVIAHTWGDT